jgi:hypothetical protein
LVKRTWIQCALLCIYVIANTSLLIFAKTPKAIARRKRARANLERPGKFSNDG